MEDDAPDIEQVEAMLRIAGIRDENSLAAILEMIENYVRNGFGNSARNAEELGDCVCGELTDEVRSRLSALRFARIAPDMSFKTCSQCRCSLPLVDFHKDKRKGDGRQGMCKRCKRVVERIRRNGMSFDSLWFGDSGLNAD